MTFPSLRAASALVLLPLALSLSACGSDDGTATPDPEVDSAIDTAIDTADFDARSDTRIATDSTTDTTAAADTTPDAASDSGPDAVSDAVSDSGSDSVSDSGTDSVTVSDSAPDSVSLPDAIGDAITTRDSGADASLACAKNSECTKFGAKFYCSFDVGNCSGVGACKEESFCPGFLATYCNCERITVSTNPCLNDVAGGKALAKSGACATP